jgi:positive regulator of sigma E activity
MTKAVWWLCPVARDHSWQAVPGKRVARREDGTHRIFGCPFCSRHRSTPRESLASDFPAISKQWHTERNSPLGPRDVAPLSHKEVWWKCAKNHVWSASIRNRTTTGGQCPYCARTRVSPDNSLAAKEPTLAAEWHPVKNGKLTPGDVTIRTGRRVWWKCRAGSDHEWQASPAKRKHVSSCPFCSNRLACSNNNLARMYPAIAKQWHPTRNGKQGPGDVVATSGRKVWWKCPKGTDHEWNCRVVNRTTRYNTGCPFCAGRRVSTTNSLARLSPHFAKEWHPKRNGLLKPSDVIATSTKTVWWKCRQGHEWKTTVRFRITLKGRTCPKCAKSSAR